MTWKIGEEYIPLKDYYFRHNKSLFWEIQVTKKNHKTLIAILINVYSIYCICLGYNTFRKSPSFPLSTRMADACKSGFIEIDTNGYNQTVVCQSSFHR